MILELLAAIGVDFVQTIKDPASIKDHSELFDIIPPKTSAIPLTAGTNVIKTFVEGLVIKITTFVLLATLLIFSTI